jgi:RNA polymerase sigma-70 factor, ECF subfamily
MASDEALVERIRAGDERAFDELYARYEIKLFGFCLRALPTREDAEEVMHEALLRGIKTDGVKFEDGGFKAYLYQTARNLCSNRRRSEARARRVAEALPEPPAPPSAEGALEEGERLRALDRAVARLPPVLGELYALRASGHTLEEIASVLAIPVGTVKSKMFHLVKLLREDVGAWTAKTAGDSTKI